MHRLFAIAIAIATLLASTSAMGQAPRATWIVTPNGGGGTLDMWAALATASPGDRLIVRAGSYGYVQIPIAVQIDCDPGVHFGQLVSSGTFGGQLTFSNAHIETLQLFASNASLRLRGCTIGWFIHYGGNGTFAVEDCTGPNFVGQGPPFPGNWTPISASGACKVTIDGSTLQGRNGWYLTPQQYIEPVPAVMLLQGATLVVTDSRLGGGNGWQQTTGFPGVPAVWTTGTTTALGGTILVAGISLQSGPARPVTGTSTVTQDCTWTGSGVPTQTIAPRSWIEAPQSVALGGTALVQAHLQPGHVAFLAFAIESAPSTIVGSLLPSWLGPSNVISVAVLGNASPNFPVAMPNLALLAGQPTYWQTVAIDAALDYELTNARSLFAQ